MHAAYVLLLMFLHEGFSRELPFFMSDVCGTSECYYAGFQVKESLNTSIEPCKNFYNFSCGGWISKVNKPDWEPFWNHWQVVANKIHDRLQFIMEEDTPVESDSNLEKTRSIYKKCINLRLSNLDILKISRDFGGWPLVSHRWKADKEKWTQFVLKAFSNYVFPLIKVHVQIDLFNTSRYEIYIEPGDTILPEGILLFPSKHLKQLNTYRIWLKDLFIYLTKHTSKQLNIEKQIMEIIEFEIQLATLKSTNNTYKQLTIEEVTNETKLDWKTFLNQLFDGSKKFDSNQNVVLKNLNYMKEIVILVNNTKARVVANFVIWSIVKDLLKYGDSRMRKFNFELEKLLLGTQATMPRKRECLNFVTKHLGHAVASRYTQLYIDADAVDEVKNILENIKVQFVHNIKASQWLSETTRELAIEKINSMKSLVGFPKFGSNEQLDFSIYNESAYKSFSQLKKNSLRRELSKLEKHTSEVWLDNIFEVNAYYSVLQNTIIIPIGLLEPPFFDTQRPELFNYAALGSLIGHELSHALDNTGRFFNKAGNFGKWWSEADIQKHSDRMTCFEKQHDQFGLDGRKTLGENVADNVGLKLSYETFFNLGNRNVAIPYLDFFTQKQLFFISFAQLWCEIGAYEYLLHGEEHAPEYVRVVTSLRNAPAFEEAFKCPENKQERCTLW